jgi:transposase
VPARAFSTLASSREGVAQTLRSVRRGDDDLAVAQNFIECGREQPFLMPPDLRDWLPENHLAWTILDAVAEMDLSAFYGDYRQDGHGRAAYDPQMMVALLLYAYSRGERSARGIERECSEDIAYRVIAANRVPDHATIARFVCRHEQALAEVFGSVLAVCAKAGLVKVGVIAVDGTKVAAIANEEQTLDYEQIAREILAEAKATDEAEDERYGEARGDELPPELSTHQGRRGWLREAKRELDRERAQNPRPIPRSRQKRLSEAKRQLDEELATERRANAAYEAYRAHGRMKDGRRFGARPTPYSPPAKPAGKINVTDPDSRLLKAPRGYVQGYNAQVVTNESQIVIAAEITVDSPDFGHLEPMFDAAERELAAAGVAEKPGVAIADAGYWHQVQMERIVDRGTQVLIPPDSIKRKSARPGWRGGLYEHMRRVLLTDHGGELYRRRQAMIEPVFAQTKSNRGMDRFRRRGRSAVRTEWRLINATHNLLKLHKHQLAAAAA